MFRVAVSHSSASLYASVKWTVPHLRLKTTPRTLNQLRKLANDVNSVRLSPRRKWIWGIVCGTVVGIPSFWYATVDDHQRRSARVTVEGVGRFLR